MGYLMLESWPISRRIGAAFAILLVLLLGVTFLAQRSSAILADGYHNYRSLSQMNVAITAYVEDMFEARVAALKYRDTPEPAFAEDVTSNIAEMLDSDEQLQNFSQSPARLSEVEKLIAMAQKYDTQFGQMRIHRTAASTASTLFLAKSDMISTQASDVFLRAVQGGNPVVISASGRLLQASMAAIQKGNRFHNSLLPTDMAEFNESYAALERAVGQLDAMGAPGPITTSLTALQGSVTGYKENLEAFAQAFTLSSEIGKTQLDRIGGEIELGFDVLADQIVADQTTLGLRGDAIANRQKIVIPAVGLFATLLAVLTAFVIGRWITGAVSRLADTTDRLASGDHDVEILGAEHAHELGRMARALSVFRTAQIERQEASEERSRLREQQDAVVGTMQTELAQLADGNLTAQITQQFAPEYEELRLNFNEAVRALHDALSSVTQTAEQIGKTTNDSHAANTDLSQRTENQAATLEQTAAALDQLTASVRSAAEHAKAVDTSVDKARTEASRNGEIVAKAVSAMEEIEASSKQISQVISVIDDIAFQTNLLALNAGVEAARAGEFGKGFAVVASEVRALAQRSAEAAKEISGLIENSSRHVAQGTQLVGNAGEALSEIITQVNDISSMTSQIATSAEEQAIGLSEINIGVNQLDQVTQQNAAMVQESMTRGDALSNETNKLSALIAKFKITRPRNAAASHPNRQLEEAIAQTNHAGERVTSAQPVRKTGTAGTDSIWQDF